MNLLTVLVVILLATNIILAVLYVAERRSSTYAVYDAETKNTLKRRVTHLKEELESELVEFDVDEWEKALEESLEEEIRKL